MTLPEEIASKAESIVNNPLETDYRHAEHIDVSARVYDCGCSGLVGFDLQTAVNVPSRGGRGECSSEIKSRLGGAGRAGVAPV